MARDAPTDFNYAVAEVFHHLNAELDNQVSLRVIAGHCGSLRVIAEVKFKLNCFDAAARGVPALSIALQQLIQGIDISALYAQFNEEFQTVIGATDYRGLLRLYNRKSLPTQIGNASGLKAGELVEL